MDDETRAGKINGQPAEAAGHCSAQGAVSLKGSQTMQGESFLLFTLVWTAFQSKAVAVLHSASEPD